MPTACWSSKRRVFNTLELTAAPETSTVFSVNPTSLQEDIEVTDGAVTGTSKYYDGSGWAAGTWTEDQKAGNFLAMKFDAVEGTTIKVKLDPSESPERGWITLDSDKNAVFRIADNTKQKLRVQGTKGAVVEEQVFSLKGVTCESE